jgi:DNA polymerase beta
VEFIATGNVAEVENVIKDPKYILGIKLKGIYGVGPAKITELMTKIKDFEELREHPELLKLLNDKQRIGLKYYDQMNLRIPMAEGKQHYKSVKNMLDASIEFEFVGSFRRKNKDMGDIDILIKKKDGGSGIVLKDIIKRFVDEKYVIEKLALGNNKFMGLCKLSPELPVRRIDILLADPSHYYFALLYFTGSYNFNIYMRKVALSKGLSLSEYGFKDSKGNLMDTTDTIHSEEDIFAYLDIPYTSPHKR